MSSPANPDLYDWQWYPDSAGGVNSPDTALAALSTTYEVPFADLGVPHWLYVGVENDGDMSAVDPYDLAYNTDGEGEVAVTTTSADVQVIVSGNETDAAAITASQVGAGIGSFVNGEFDEGDGTVDANVTSGNHSCFCFCIQFTTALGGGESIDLFLRYNRVTADLTNDSGATINVTIGAAPVGQLLADHATTQTVQQAVSRTGNF